MVMKVGRVQVGTKTIKLSCEDAQDKDEWRLRIKGLLATNPVYLENGHYRVAA